MSARQRLVFDASAIVSALLFEHSVPARAFYHAIDRGKILLSREVVEELNEVVRRKKFDRYLDREDRVLFLQALLREATLIEVTDPVQVCRDPKDDKYLSLAVAGQANCVVTGDEDLLALGSFRGIRILTPSQFLASLTERTEGGGT